MNEQSSSVATATSAAVTTTKPLLEVICFPSAATGQESWVRRYLRENPWTSDCPHDNSNIVISKNGKKVELARKQTDINVNNYLKCTYYHFAAFVDINGERYKLTDSDHLCFGLGDFQTYIDKMALFFSLHDIELKIRVD